MGKRSREICYLDTERGAALREGKRVRDRGREIGLMKNREFLSKRLDFKKKLKIKN